MPVTKVKSRWTAGNLEFLDSSGNVIATLDGTNRKLSIPAGSVLEYGGASSAGAVRNIRTRFTIAQVNAGASFLPAVAGFGYRMVSCYGIAIGGAAGAVTTVDILGTVSTPRKLVAFAQASLAQSTVLKDGGSGAAVLADGASYTVNDVNTGITVGKTGSDITTATHIDVIFSYTLEAP